MPDRSPVARPAGPGQPPVDLNALFGAMTEVVLVLNREGRYVWAAPTLAAASERNQQRTEWLMGKTIHEVFADKAEADRLVHAIQTALKTRETQHVEYKMDLWGTLTTAALEPSAAPPVSDGSEVMWFAAAVSPIDNDRVVWVARDVTRRVNARQELEHAVDERTQEMSALLEISRALSSTLELDPLLNSILDHLKLVVPYDGAGVDLIIDDELRQVAVRRPRGFPTTTQGSTVPIRVSDLTRAFAPLLENRPVYLPDVTDQTPQAVAYRASWGGDLKGTTAEWVCSLMLVPMFARDRLIGCISVAHTQRDFFTPEHISVVQSVASQAAVAVDNARLFEETQSRARESRALLGTARAIVSTLELQPLMEVVLDELRNVIPYDGAGVTLREGDYFSQIAVRRPAGQVTELSPRVRIDSAGKLIAKVLAGECVVIDDVEDDSEYARAFRRAWGGSIKGSPVEYVRSWLGVPLVSRNVVIGMLTIVKSEPGFFRDEHAAIGQLFAGQAAAAIENARLFEETQRRAREQAALIEISRTLSSTLELHPLLNLIIDQLKTVVPYSGAGLDLVVGGEFKQLAVRRPPGYSTDPAAGQPIVRVSDLPESLQPLLRNEPVQIPDVTDDSAAARSFRTGWEDLKATTGAWVRSLLLVPVFARDTLIGSISVVHSEPDFFSNEQVRIVQSVASQAAAAIENARLFEETQRRARETEALLGVARGLSSTLELAPLLDLLLNELATVVPNHGASIHFREGDRLVRLAGRANTPEGVVPVEPPNSYAISFLGPLWEEVERRSFVLIEDTHGDSELARVYQQIWGGKLQGTPVEFQHSFLAVPLRRRDETVGMLVLGHADKDHFRDDHIGLTRAVAAQALAAIENARLFEETRRRARETEALLEISRTLASTLDAAQTLGAILDQLGAITEYTGASILVVREDAFEFVEARSITGTRAEVGARILYDVAPLLAAAMRQGTVIIDDIRADEPLAADYRAAIDSLGVLDQPPFNVIRSWMSVPLVVRDRVLGVLTISWTEPSYFTPEHARLARAFADQAVVAMENARLFGEAQQNAREFEALSQADTELFRSLDLNTVLQALVDVSVDVLGTDKSMVSTWDAEATAMSLRASRNLAAGTLAYIRELFNRRTQRLEAPNAGQERYDDSLVAVVLTEDPDRAPPHLVPIFEAEGIRSMIEIPIFSPAGLPLGFFSVAYTTEHKFLDDEQRLLKALADRAAVAIENAALYERAQQAASLEERQRLARELHDSVSQALYGIALGARTARTLLDRDPPKATEPVDYVLSLAEAGLTEMRALIFELRPESLETEGLVAAIQRHAAALQARYSIQVDCPDCAEPTAPLPVKEAAYRIVQEALTNTVKHAHATQAAVKIDENDDAITLTITDNGAGFDPGGDFPGHLGLKSMRERALKLGGDLTIESKPNAGTRVRATLPVPP